MFPYFLLLFISTVCPLLFYQTQGGVLVFGDDQITRKRNKMTLILFFAGLFVLLALRDITVGKDLNEYKVIFERCYRSSLDELINLKWELGYTVYNKIIAYVSKDYRFFLIVTAALTLIPIYKLYSQETKYSFLLIVLFVNMPCFLMIFSGLRQAIATSIGIFVFMAMEKKKYFERIAYSACFIVSPVCMGFVVIVSSVFYKDKSKTFVICASLNIGNICFSNSAIDGSYNAHAGSVH